MTQLEAAPPPHELGPPDARAISALIADVYDAALDPDLWPGALEGLCRLVEGGAAFLYFQDLAGTAGDAFYAWGDDPGSREPRFRSYSRCNPAIDGSLALPVGKVSVGSQLIPAEALRSSQLYREWMQPEAYCDFATVLLARSNLRLACLTVANRDDQGCIERRQVERLDLLAPHFQRSAAIAELLGQRKMETAAFEEALDRLKVAVFMVDANGQVVHVNALGREMLDRGAVLNCRRDVLAATDRTAERALRTALAAAANGRTGGEAAKAGPVRLSGADGVDHLAHILPLTTGHRREAGVRLAAASVVFVHRATSALESSAEVVGRLYGLTSGEVRVLKALVEGGGTREVAQALKVSENTVNTHLRHVFEKTGTCRQADLVRLVAVNRAPVEV